MIKIIEKSGIPCIVLPEGVIIPKTGLKFNSIDYPTINSFTDILRQKERNSYKDILEELKKKLNYELQDI